LEADRSSGAAGSRRAKRSREEAHNPADIPVTELRRPGAPQAQADPPQARADPPQARADPPQARADPPQARADPPQARADPRADPPQALPGLDRLRLAEEACRDPLQRAPARQGPVAQTLRRCESEER
jgi:hypothetical protein